MIRTLTIAAALALAACGQTTSTPAAPAPEPAAEQSTASDDAVTPAFLVGRWGDNGDCTSVVTYNADGTFQMRDGSTGRWTLDGDRLTMSGERGDFGVQIAKGNENQLLIGQPDGCFGISQRC
jgi:hypothetical protein